MRGDEAVAVEANGDNEAGDEGDDGVKDGRLLEVLQVQAVLDEAAAVHGLKLLPGKLELAGGVGHVGEVAVEGAVRELRVERLAGHGLALGNLAADDAVDPAVYAAADDPDDEEDAGDFEEAEEVVERGGKRLRLEFCGGKKKC